MAIVSTLWSLALLGAIAISLCFTGNVSYRLAQNSFHAATDEALTEATINRAVLALLDPRPDHRLALNTTSRFTLGGASVDIRVQDELGKVDINQVDAPILIALLQWAGLDGVSASALLDKILDWRDRNPLKRINGAKADEYRAAGYDYAPRNGPFKSLDELLLVMGVTPDLYRKIVPALTVYSGRPFVDPQFSPPEVLAALPSLANAVAAQRAAGTASYGGIGDPMLALKGRAFSIDVGIARPNGVAHHHGAIRLTGNPNEPFWILSWQRS